jgi:hypothetical protein
MNKILFPFIISVVFSYSVKAQCADAKMSDIYTPMGSPVTTWITCEASTSTRQGFDDYYAQTYPNAQQIKTYDNLSSTRKFNCHGYAWLREEQGIDRWIGYSVDTDENVYMTDGSYVQVSQSIYPGKVSWASGDHSAVTTGISGILVSKWNEYPLMRHAWNYSPYGSGNLKYYRLNTPVVTSITGPTGTPNMQYASYTANVSPGSNPTNYQWILNPQLNNNLYGADSRVLDIAFYTAGNYQLVCRAYNPCGWGEYTVTGLTVYNAGAYALPSPNPASSALTVSFNPELVAQAQQQPSGGLQATKRAFMLTVKLYDDSGLLQRQTTSAGESITFDVSGLKNGLYILHVSDGMAEKPETHKILVNH